MKQEDDKLRNLLQDVFNDYEVTPEPGDWNRIAESLNQSKGRRRFLWPIWSAAATILLLLALYTGNEYFSNKPSIAVNHKTNTITNAQNRTTTVKRQTSSILSVIKQPSEKKSLTKPGHEQAVVKNTKTEKVHSDKILAANSQKLIANKQLPIINNQQPKANSQKQSSAKESTVPKTNADNIVVTDPTLASADKKKEISSEKAKEQLAQEQLNALKENREKKQATSTRTFILTGLALGNSSGFQTAGGGSDNLMAYDVAYSSPSLTSNMYLNSVKIYDLTATATPNISSIYQNIERNFKTPLTIAFTATFSLGAKFSLESGLQYTNLQSDGEVTIKSANDVQFITFNTYNVNEVLHYVGIPIFVNYTLTGNKRFKTFISSGLTFEKGIQAYYKAVSKDNIPGTVKFNSHSSIKGSQESFSGGIGLSYSFIPHFELYFQPSLTYYFKTNDSNVTIYSTNPWLINLRSGIRYNFK